MPRDISPLKVVPLDVKFQVIAIDSPCRHLRLPNDMLLEARGISKSFPGVKALDGVDITVRRGRLNALLGENGAGKSTLMNILAGVFPPDEGEILLDGRSRAIQEPARSSGGRHLDHLSGAQSHSAPERRGEHLSRPRAAHAARPDRLSAA